MILISNRVQMFCFSTRVHLTEKNLNLGWSFNTGWISTRLNATASRTDGENKVYYTWKQLSQFEDTSRIFTILLEESAVQNSTTSQRQPRKAESRLSAMLDTYLEPCW